jgi:hypothetical protein
LSTLLTHLGEDDSQGTFVGFKVDVMAELKRRIARRTCISLANYRYLRRNRDSHIPKYCRTVEPLYKDMLRTSDLISINKTFVGKRMRLRNPDFTQLH